MLLATALAMTITSSDITEVAVTPNPDGSMPSLVEITPGEFVDLSFRPIPPQYPRSAASRGQEGWVELSYVVDEQGQVNHVVVSDSNGIESLEQAAIDALMQIDFEPATLNGEPVVSCRNSHRYTFYMDDGGFSGRRHVRLNNQILEAWAEGDFEAVTEGVTEMSELPRNNLYDEASFRMLNALLAEHNGENTLAISEYREAFRWGENRLTKENLTIIVTNTYRLLLQEGRYQEAIMWAHQAANPVGESNIQNVLEHANSLAEQLTEVEALPTRLTLSDRGGYLHELTRPVFQLAADEGQLDSFELRCDASFKAFEFNPDVAVQVPASWGSCAVWLSGQADASAVVYEFNE